MAPRDFYTANLAHPISILVVEDSVTQAQQLKFLLEKHGYAVTCAGNGLHALRAIRECRPTLVISDIVMPEMNGYQLCSIIRSNAETADLPVVLLTTLSSAKDILLALQCGADNFITKPYNETYLVTRMEQILERLRLRAEAGLDAEPEVVIYGRERYHIATNRQRMLDLLISTYESTVMKNRELQVTQDTLRKINSQLEIVLKEKEDSIAAVREAHVKTEEALGALRQKDALLTQWHDELAALNRIGSAINHSATHEELFSQVSEELVHAGLFGVRYGVRFRILENQELQFSPAGIQSRRGDGVPTDDPATRVCERAMASGKVEVLPEFSPGCERCHGGPATGRTLTIPLRAKEKTVGVLCLATAAGYEPEPRQREMLEALGKQLGIAVENLRLYEETRRLSLHDPLTGLANRRMMDIALENTLARANRFKNPCSVLVIDIDHFKRYNDAHGHDAGDRILARTAAVVQGITRTTDLAARFGGEEFVVILSDADLESAAVVAEKHRAAIQDEIGVTVSIGAAQYEPGMTREELFKAADGALYRAKQFGRNRVELALPVTQVNLQQTG